MLSDGDAEPILCSALKELLLRAFSRHQILVLKELRSNGYYLNITNLIEKVSEEHNISASTLRWNVKKLRKLRLIECGTYNSKGIPAKLTASGKLISKILSRDCSSMGEHSNEDRGVRGSSPRSPIKKKKVS